MVGTGETVSVEQPAADRARLGRGSGVLAAKGPPTAPLGARTPGSRDRRSPSLEGLGIFRIWRATPPSAGRPSSAGPGADRVLAATSAGLFLGTRAPRGRPARRPRRVRRGPRCGGPDRWSSAGRHRQAATSSVTDVLWLPGRQPRRADRRRDPPDPPEPCQQHRRERAVSPSATTSASASVGGRLQRPPPTC